MASDNTHAENGEVEEGELPTEFTPDKGHESGEASGFEDTHPRRRRLSRQVLSKPPPDFTSPRFLGRDPAAGPRVVISPRGAPPPGSKHNSRDQVQDEQARQAAKDEKEREELTSMLRELTRYVSVQDAMRSLDTVCVDLKKAIKKLDKLLRKVKKKKTDDLASYPECLQFSKRIMEGLRSINVVVGTSIGHTHSMDAVLALFRAAMNYRHDVFVAAQKQELEVWVRTTKVLKTIIEEKERGKVDPKASGSQRPDEGEEPEMVAVPESVTFQQHTKNSLSGPPPASPEDRGITEQGRTAAVEDVDTTSQPTALARTLSSSEAASLPPLPPPLPPPPAEPYPAHGSPISEDIVSQELISHASLGAAAPQTGEHGTVVPSGSGATASRQRAGTAASAAAAFKFNIVVSSTAADIKKPLFGTLAAPALPHPLPSQCALEQQQQQQEGAPSATISDSGNVMIRDRAVQVVKRAGLPTAGDQQASKKRRSESHTSAGDLIENAAKRSEREAGQSQDRDDSQGPDGRRSRDRSRSKRTSVGRTTSCDERRRRSRSRGEGNRSQSREWERGRSREKVRGVSREVPGAGSGEREGRRSRWDRQPVASRSPGHSSGPPRQRSHSPDRSRVPGSCPHESPMSDDGPTGITGGVSANGHGSAVPVVSGVSGPPRSCGWTFEERERHRLERERTERERMMERERDLLGPGARDRDGPTEREEVGALVRRGRMVLALDLDHTLLNSVRFADLDIEIEAQLGQRLAVEASSVPDHQRELYRSERLGIWTKLRPGAREFLARAVEKFELWVYSAGTRPYADAMASLLDPEDRYFEGRIIAAGGGVDGPDGPSAMHNKHLLAVLEALRPVVLALDDAGALWPAEHRLALLSVERYLFFPATRRRFGLEGRSLLQINRDECPDRGMLLTMWHLIERLHGLLFMYLHHPGPAGQLLSGPPAEPRLPPWDMRNVVMDERRKVLQGVCLVFSRIFPMDMDPRGHPLWRMAEAFGAVCDVQCTERTTHVITATRGTEKSLWAAQRGKLVVTPAWLECCCTLWRKANEDRFIMPLDSPDTQQAHVP